MSALAGFLNFGVDLPAGAMCGRILGAQSIYGPHAQDMEERGGIAFGRCLFRLLPEDRFDRQPLTSSDGRLLLVADVRIDNRAELLATLGDPDSGENRSDADILLAAWERWGAGTLQRLFGDFAFALWDMAEQTLTLARDPVGQRPLHYHSGSGFFAFATMPAALCALPQLRSEPDAERLAQFVADLPHSGSRSFFAKVSQVQSGSMVTVTRQGVDTFRYWQPDPAELRLPRAADYAEALVEQIDRATSAQLRRAQGRIGTHLSSGWDSSAVTAAAAGILARRGEGLVAFTSAPREGFDGPVPRGRIADESAAAAETAARYANIEHHIMRPDGTGALGLLERGNALAQHPTGHVCNNMWWSAINRTARDRGVSVMLTGELGNHTISAGSFAELAGLVGKGRWRSWRREAQAVARRGDIGWRSILAASLGPFIPEWLYLALRRLGGFGAGDGASDNFVGAAWSAEMARQRRGAGWDSRPPGDPKKLRLDLIRLADPGNFRKATLAAWGIDERDPTADRRLIEFCLSLPGDMLLRDGVRRPALRAALANRLPRAVLDQRLRGSQMADWYEQIPQAAVAEFAHRLRLDRFVSLIDPAEVETALGTWPRQGWAEQRVIARYRMKLLRTLSAAQFLDSFQDSASGAPAKPPR